MNVSSRSTGTRGLVTAVVAIAAGAGLELYAVTRTWATAVEQRPSPLPPLTVSHTGTSWLGWLPAIALVGLAGAGALLATRGPIRVGLGAVLGLVGLVIFGGGLDGTRFSTGARIAWPLVVAAGGVAIAWGGFQAMRHGPSWPAMGARYERPRASAANRPVTDATMWDDLDRGIDPTDDDRRPQ